MKEVSWNQWNKTALSWIIFGNNNFERRKLTARKCTSGLRRLGTVLQSYSKTGLLYTS